MRINFYCIALWLVVCSCGNTETKPEETAPAREPFFPIAEYIRGEIKIVDSLPVGILKKLIRGPKIDSTFIDRSEFHTLAAAFSSSDLQSSKLEEMYKESSFMDNTTGYYTFTYEPIAVNAPYERIDVLVKPGELKDKVNSIYLKKSSNQNDTSINERLYWKANTSFSITKEKKYKDQAPVVEQLLVIWDPSAY